jgi:hypothetical protein
MAQRVKRVKTPEQIMKANLGKCLTKMKTQVADREELWLELFTNAIDSLIGREDFRTDGIYDMMIIAETIANTALDRYENRWGKG